MAGNGDISKIYAKNEANDLDLIEERKGLPGFDPTAALALRSRLGFVRSMDRLAELGADAASATFPGPRRYSALAVAAQAGQEASAAWLLERGVRDPEALPQIAASPSANPKAAAAIAKALLAAGADPNAPGQSGRPPLFEAANLGRSEIVSLLLEAGADPNARTADGKTALHLANCSKRKSPEAEAKEVGRVCRALLAAGADPNARDAEGNTPLHQSVGSAGYPTKWDLLASAGADLSAENAAGLSILPNMAAAKMAEGPLLKALRAGAGFRSDGTPGSLDPLAHCCENGFEEAARELLSAGADVNFGVHPAKTPLHLAAQWHPELIPTLLAAGADPNLATMQGFTPLHHVLGGRHLDAAAAEAVAALVEAGADVDARLSTGHTPLHAAANNGLAEAASRLLDRGADPDARSKEGNAPLHVAMLFADSRGALDVAEVLLSKGAAPFAVNAAGKTPLDLVSKESAPRARAIFERAEIDFEIGRAKAAARSSSRTL